MATKEMLETILKGCVWGIKGHTHTYTFKSYIYRGTVFLKLVVEGDRLIHIGSVRPDGWLDVNKKWHNTRRPDVIHMKQFFHELFTQILSRDWEWSVVDEQRIAELYVSQAEQKDERDWLHRLGIERLGMSE